MAQAHVLPALSAAQPSASAGHAGETKLIEATPGERVRIVHLAQEAEHAAWLRAVGMHEGAEVTVLRKAPFGGPIHLRSSDGGEFAIHRDLARCIQVGVALGRPPSGSNG
jgi:ferrous iron transport protein A